VPSDSPPNPESMSGTGPALEMAHVLFTDIVAYSKLPMEQQQRFLGLLQEAVRSTKTFTRAQSKDRLVCLPTGDGMALVFFGNPEYPVQCALELNQRLRDFPEIKLRMGIHTGPVYRVADINAARNVSGGGINIAQRVMDCGDAGHILVSKVVADMLAQVSTWSKVVMKDLGEVEVKHGVRVHIYNLSSDDAGNAALPQKLKTAEQTVAAERSKTKRKKMLLAIAAALLVIAMAAGGLFYSRRQSRKLTVKDTIVLADFANKTGDAVFDDTLKTALGVALNQSPFLNVLSDAKVSATLKLMARPANLVLTPDVAREVCLRTSSKAYIAGSIVSMGDEHVVELQAVDCQSGDLLAQEMARAPAKQKVLDALGEAASKLRSQLGESMATVHKFDVPLEQATTSSLDALKAYTLGRKVYYEKGPTAALVYDQNAIQLDPNFAAAYRALGDSYSSLNETGRAKEYYTKAFTLREHVGERERLLITGDYYLRVTGELDKATQTFEEYIESYPRDFNGYNNLGRGYSQQGQYDKALNAFGQVLEFNPDMVLPSPNAVNCLLALQRFDEARQMLQPAPGRNLDKHSLRSALYALAFIASDSLAMSEQQQWLMGNPAFRNIGLQLAADTEAYAGHLGKARGLTKQAVDSALKADNRENGAQWQGNGALREAAFGNGAEALQGAGAGLKLAPDSPGVTFEAALAFAMAGDTARAESVAQDLNRRFPLDTQVQSLWLPAIRAQLALNKQNPAKALEDLQPADPHIEFGNMAFATAISCLYPTYIRGQAYLAAGQGSAAVSEFQKIADHSGIVWNCWTAALARLGIARGNALEARSSQGADSNAARVRALAAYKEFLNLWKDADPGIPILKEARAEYAKLQ